MATSYLSQKYEPSAVSSNINLPLTLKVLEMKQGKYDTAKAQINQTLDQFGGLKAWRDIDNKYIASKLTDIRNNIETMGDVDLSRSGITDSIMGNIKQVAQDPFILNALEQTYKKKAYDIEAEKYKKEGKYADKNYAYGLYKAGAEDYLAGKTEKIGNLSYTPYTNYKEKLIKHAKEFAQQNGQEQLLQGNVQHGKYHTVDVYGKVVRKDELNAYLYNVLDDGDKAQLNIDAWDNFRAVPDNQAMSMAEEKTKSSLKTLETRQSEIKARLDSGEKTVEPILSQYKEAIEQKKAKINNKQFSKQDLYDDFMKGELDGIADAFDMNIITKKDVDNATFEELKFEDSQKKWALDFDLKLKTLKATEKTNQILQDQALGTKFDKPVTDDQAQEIPQDLLIKAKVRDGAITLKDELSKFDPEFAKYSEAEKFNYLVNLNLSNVAEAKNYPPGFSKKLKEFQQSQRALSNMTENVTKAYRETTTSSFNDMSKEAASGRTKLNLDAISEYAPMTANVLKNVKKSGQYFDFNNLSPDVRKSIQIELMNANLKQSPNVDDNVKRMAETSINTLLSSIKDKKVANSVKANVSRTKAEKGYFEEGLEGLKETGSFLYDIGAETLDASFRRPFETILEGSDYADKRFDERSKNRLNQDPEKMKGIFNILPYTAPFMFAKDLLKPILSEEENLQNIEARDLGGAENIGHRFQTQNQALSGSLKAYTDSVKKNLDFNYAFMFDSTNKAQKPIADLIEQTVINEDKGFDLAKDNNYSIQKVAEGYQIMFDTKEDGRQTVTVAKLPSALAGVVDASEDRWSDSIYNPLTDFTPVNVTAIKSTEETERRRDNIVNEYPDARYEPFIMDIERGIFKPIDEYIRQDVSKPIFEKNKDLIESFLGQQFRTETEVNPYGQLSSKIKYIDLDGKPKTKVMLHSFTEKNDALLNVEWYSKIDQIKKEALKSLEK